MNTFRTKFSILFTLFVLTSMATAQQLNLGTSGVLQAGETVKIEYSDPSRAGETITITISNGAAAPFDEEVSIDVTLDANGQGTVEWVVDGDWDRAYFYGPGAAELMRPIGSAKGRFSVLDPNDLRELVEVDGEHQASI
ncbi:MAG: hypothetical protein ACE37K_12545 [Planctomycetota bacterium]